jgi:Zn-dependent protease with chaperone function
MISWHDLFFAATIILVLQLLWDVLKEIFIREYAYKYIYKEAVMARESEDLGCDESTKRLRRLFEEVRTLFKLPQETILYLEEIKKLSPAACMFSYHSSSVPIIRLDPKFADCSDDEIKGTIAHEFGHFFMRKSIYQFLCHLFGFLIFPYLFAESSVDLFAAKVIGPSSVISAVEMLIEKNKDVRHDWHWATRKMFEWRIKRIKKITA